MAYSDGETNMPVEERQVRHIAKQTLKIEKFHINFIVRQVNTLLLSIATCVIFTCYNTNDLVD